MRNKVFTSLLLLVALLVWGVIIYRFVDMQGEPAVPEVDTDAGDGAEKQPQMGTLRLDYRDPFLGKRSIPAPPPAVVRKQKTEMDTVRPGFRLIAKIRKGVKDFLVIDRGRGHEMVTPQHQIDGFTVRKVTDDSIVVSRSDRCYTLWIER